MNAPINVMVDLETTATRADAGILSIGAVVFGIPNAWDVLPFYERVALESLKEEGFAVSKATMDWWDKQDSDVRIEAFGGTTEISLALSQFSTWIAQLHAPVILWGNGADFANAILAYAFDHLDLEYPISHKNSRCFRTLKALLPDYPEIPFQGSRHNALADAQHQARCANAMLEMLARMKQQPLPAQNKIAARPDLIIIDDLEAPNA